MVQEIQRAGKGSAAKTPWFTKAVREGTFKMVYTVLQLAVVVLCCAVLCCAVLRCAALCCAVLRCAAMLCCHAVLAILLEQTQILFAHTHVMSVLKFAVEPHAVATFQTCRRPCPGMRRGVWHWRAP